ncbi:chaplin family protein [Streptomyces hypolithicus]
MRQVLSRGVFAAAAASGLLAMSGGSAHADAGAAGQASNSPGVLSGNNVQAPVHVPVNVCGNTVNVVAFLNPAFGNECANVSSSKKSPGHDRPGHERPGGGHPGGGHPGGGNPGGGHPGQEPPGHEHPGEEPSGGKPPAGEQPGHEQPGHEQPGHEQPGHETPGHEQPPECDEPGGSKPGGPAGPGKTPSKPRPVEQPAEEPQAPGVVPAEQPAHQPQTPPRVAEVVTPAAVELPAQAPRGIEGAPALAHTGADDLGVAAALSAALIGGGVLLFRRTKAAKV